MFVDQNGETKANGSLLVNNISRPVYASLDTNTDDLQILWPLGLHYDPSLNLSWGSLSSDGTGKLIFSWDGTPTPEALYEKWTPHWVTDNGWRMDRTFDIADLTFTPVQQAYVPEPSSVAIWTGLAIVAIVVRRRAS